MRTKLLILATALFASIGCNTSQEFVQPLPANTIIPQPKEIVAGEGEFEINAATSLCYDAEFEGVANYLLKYIPLSHKGEQEENDLPDNKPERGSGKGRSKSSEGDYLIISDKLNNISFSMAKCCNPIFGDDVFGFVSATGGIKIHRISCPNAARLIEKYPYRLQKVKWRQVSNTTQFQTALKVIGDGDAAIAAQLIDCVTKQDASMRSFTINERRKPGNQTEFVAEIGISVGNNAHLDRVTSALKKIREVKTVLRTSRK